MKKRVSKEPDTLPDLLRKRGTSEETKRELTEAFVSYAVTHDITVGSEEWKGISLKELLPILREISSRWDEIDLNIFNTSTQKGSRAISKYMSRLRRNHKKMCELMYKESKKRGD